jgi:hypothetical protein
MIMIPQGYAVYKQREFCKNVQSPAQLDLNPQTEGTPAYKQTRQKSSIACLYTTWQFHHWLIEKGYLILKLKTSTEK